MPDNDCLRQMSQNNNNEVIKLSTQMGMVLDELKEIKLYLKAESEKVHTRIDAVEKRVDGYDNQFKGIKLVMALIITAIPALVYFGVITPASASRTIHTPQAISEPYQRHKEDDEKG